MKHKLIVLEGIDGVGKTTMARLLQKSLSKLGIPVIVYEQYEKRGKGFNAIKPFIKKETPIDASILFYAASAVYKSHLIGTLLKKTWVICDRYAYSTFAYHRIRGANKSLVDSLEKLPIRQPDFHFLIKVKERIRMQRARTKKMPTFQDLQPKRKGNLIAKMEGALERFKPIVIDNSSNNVHATVQKVLRIIITRRQ